MADEPAPLYQPLQRNQCNTDAIYAEVMKPEQAVREYELCQITKERAEEVPNDCHLLNPNQRLDDASYQEKEEERNDIKKKIFTVTVIFIMFMLLLIVAVGIATVAVLTHNKITEISIQLNATNNKISQLSTSTESTVHLISMQLTTTNGNVTSALNEVEMTQEHITTELEVTHSNITSVHSQIVDLRSQVARLQTQFTGLQIQLHCGPGEWHRVAYLNMSDPIQQCPSAWREYDTGGVRACGRPSTSGGSCAATTYSIDFQYSRVCGRVIGYQFGSPDGFLTGDITQRYVDGISITRGLPRQHVWTYAAGLTESGEINHSSNCPCSSHPGRRAPSFVRNNYYCESGNPTDTYASQFYTGDKLWDGLQCEGSCCTGVDTPPWFKVQLYSTTNDDIEVRICGSEGTSSEDTPVELIEIYSAM